MRIASKISPCLWFDDRAEEAVRFYASIFPDSRIVQTSYYTEAGQEIHGHPPGSVMALTFELAGQSFSAINGGPLFQFTEAISLQIDCKDQAEVDYYWSKLTDGGSEQPCGWLKDKFGVSWQVVPSMMADLFTAADPARASRVLNAMFPMMKLDIATLERAAKG